MLLAAIIKQVTGNHADVFAAEHLFGPTGITRVEWLRARNGMPQMHFGLRLTPRDMLKLGRLYLQRGDWQGARIVSADWISSTVTPHFGNNRYGYGGWLDKLPVHGKPTVTWAAEGNGGQFIFILPDEDLVTVFTGGNYGQKVQFQSYCITTRHILPALLP